MTTSELRALLERLDPQGEMPVRLEYPAAPVAGAQVRWGAVLLLTESDVRRRDVMR